jgi:uracil-DNA glycosylase
MRTSDYVQCVEFPCSDINTARYTVAGIEVDPAQVKILMISEAPPPDASDEFYAAGDPFYLQTTLQAFEQAGASVSSVQDLLSLGVYITTAIKCGKIGYGVSAQTIKNCSELLEEEMSRFPNVQAILLMGDVAIKAMNYIARRQAGKRLIPSGSTYKIRRNEYSYQGLRVFPSYLQTGKSFLIEKSKRAMIAEDIRAALDLFE